jgi:hypothetical protein
VVVVMRESVVRMIPRFLYRDPTVRLEGEWGTPSTSLWTGWWTRWGSRTRRMWCWRATMTEMRRWLPMIHVTCWNYVLFVFVCVAILWQIN